MHELKKWAEKYRQVCVLLGIFGLLLSPFLWPFFLAIILSSLSLAVPVLAVYLIVGFVKKEKKDEKRDRRQEQAEDLYPDAAEAVSEERTEHKMHAEKEHIQKKEQKRAEPVNRKSPEPATRKRPEPADTQKEDDGLDQEAYAALSWYQMEGKDRIFRIIEKLGKEGIQSFSVNPEGICTVRSESGFRRVGVLRAFPKQRLKVIEREINKAGIRTNTSGKYLWMSWGKGVHR